MKKILLWMMAAILTCGTTTLITSCSKDDVEDFLESVNLIGEWRGYDVKITPSPGYDMDLYIDGGTITFESDYTVYNSDGDEGEWSLKNKVVTIKWIDGRKTYTETFTIKDYSSNNMVIESTFDDVDDKGKTVHYTVEAKLRRIY